MFSWSIETEQSAAFCADLRQGFAGSHRGPPIFQQRVEALPDAVELLELVLPVLFNRCVGLLSRPFQDMSEILVGLRFADSELGSDGAKRAALDS